MTLTERRPPLKITRLSSTDVANVSVLPFEKKRVALEAIEEPRVSWGYQPVEAALPKLLLATSALFGDLPSGNDDLLVRQIERECKKGPQQRAACVAVAEAIIDWRNTHKVVGRVVHPEPLRMSVDTLRYCADVVPIFEGRPYIVHLDCRSKMSLTVGGKEFMKSLIHHTARVGDLRDASVGILRVPLKGKGTRRCLLEPLDGEPRHSLDELLSMVNETYTIWEVMCRSRREGAAATGSE
jgi:hypothetical protein